VVPSHLDKKVCETLAQCKKAVRVWGKEQSIYTTSPLMDCWLGITRFLSSHRLA
jgi:hypothetical protein